MLTLREALKLDNLRNTIVIAGHHGLNREIRFVNVMEVPDIVDWVSEGELLLTTGYPIKDSPGEWVDLIAKLNDKKIAGLAIKPHRFIERLQDEAIRVADYLNLPILELPPEAQFDQIIRGLLTEIVNRDYKVIKRSEEIHQTFTNLVLEGGGFTEIAQALADLCYSNVTISDVSGRVLAQANPKDATYSPDSISDDCNKLFKKPVQLRNQVIAYISLISWRKSIEKEDLVAIERATTVIAMVLLKHEKAKEMERRQRNDLLNDIVGRKLESRSSVIERGKFFGLDLTLPYLLYVIEVDSFEETYLEILRRDEEKAHNLLNALFNLIYNTVVSKARESIVWDRSGRIIVLYPIRKGRTDVKKYSKDLAREIWHEVNQNIKDITVTIGIGSFYPDIMDISKSYWEACLAIEIGRHACGNNGVYHYEELGVYQLLAQFPDKKILNQFVDREIGKLIAYDKKKNTKLLPTLEQLLISNNLKAVAEKLYIHPKTLTFRKKRIEEVLGVSLDDAEVRLSLLIAIKIFHMNANKIASE